MPFTNKTFKNKTAEIRKKLEDKQQTITKNDIINHSKFTKKYKEWYDDNKKEGDKILAHQIKEFYSTIKIRNEYKAKKPKSPVKPKTPKSELTIGQFKNFLISKDIDGLIKKLRTKPNINFNINEPISFINDEDEEIIDEIEQILDTDELYTGEFAGATDLEYYQVQKYEDLIDINMPLTVKELHKQFQRRIDELQKGSEILPINYLFDNFTQDAKLGLVFNLLDFLQGIKFPRDFRDKVYKKLRSKINSNIPEKDPFYKFMYTLHNATNYGLVYKLEDLLNDEKYIPYVKVLMAANVKPIPVSKRKEFVKSLTNKKMKFLYTHYLRNRYDPYSGFGLKARSENKKRKEAIKDTIGTKKNFEQGLGSMISDFAYKGGKKIRKHKGINQQTGKLKRGYKYSGKRLKSGLPQIIKIKKN